nr:sigma-70 family RNA polymerase sigma factor [Nitrosomonas nitrosa]
MSAFAAERRLLFEEMTDDCHLIRAWVQNRDEEAFRTLVDRHLNLVYSVARRLISDEHLAEEVAQSVFVVLAHKAPTLSGCKALPAWLYRTTQYAAAQAIRGEARRAERHRRFADMQTTEADSPWAKMAPLLDAAMSRLRTRDREALVLRFMGEMSIEQVGVALGVSEEAARKRIDRALEKLKRILVRRGLSTTTAILTATLSANALQAAPFGLSSKIAAATLASTVTTSVATATIVSGTLHFMAWTKAKVIGIAVAAVLLGGVATTVVVKNGGLSGAIPGDDPITILRAQLTAAGGTPEQIDNLICVDNLKMLGAALTGRAQVPTDPLTLKDQLDTPQRFHCPQDTAKKVPRRWSELQRSDISYAFGAAALTPGTPAIVRCPIHGHVLMPGGQVIQGTLLKK